MATEHFATLRQALPRLWQLLAQLEPTYHVETVAEINAAFLETEEIRAVLWDVDGTLMAYHASDIDAAFPHIRQMFRDGPAKHGILSNCDEGRFDELGAMFGEIPVVRGYSTAQGTVFRHILRGVDTHSPGDVRRILAAGGRQIRKPSGELVEYGMQLLGETDRRTVLMVGDQYLTDIASANLAGTRSAKVKTFRKDSFPLQIRTTQRLEGLLRAARARRSRKRAGVVTQRP